jgi:hypothetical protein
MIRLLTAVLFLIYSHFGWAMAYPEDYNGVPYDDFKEGDVIDHTKFNQNNLSLKEAINGRVPVPSNCSTDQIIKYDGGGWVCTDIPEDGADGADGAPGANGADGADGLGSPFVWQYSDSCDNLASGRFCQALGNNGPRLQFYASDSSAGLWTVIGQCTGADSYIYDTYLVDISDVASLVFWRAQSSFSSSSGAASYLYIEQAGNSTVALPFSVDDTVALVPLGCTPPEPDPFGL